MRRPEFRPRKLPAQRRSRITFEALVQACDELLAEVGYSRTTTNHIAERAGVNIASLYEYFPGKDAIVAQVAARLVERVLAQLAHDAAALRAAPAEEAVRRWIDLVYDAVARERRLMDVFAHQVPYANDIEAVRDASARLLAFSEVLHQQAEGVARRDISRAEMQLIVNLTSSTILQLVLDPPGEAATREVLDELGRRLDAWIR